MSESKWPRAPSSAKVLAVKDLHKNYGDSAAIDGITFEVDRKGIVGLLGSNGAGKTTTINMILGVLAASSGTIHIEGLDVARHCSQAVARTNFAAVVCVRRHADGHHERHLFGSRDALGRRACRAGCGACLLVLHSDSPACRTHRPHRPLQC